MLTSCVPPQYHHAIKPIPGAENETKEEEEEEERTFHPFPNLPAELRLEIWSLAAAAAAAGGEGGDQEEQTPNQAQPRRILHWDASYNYHQTEPLFHKRNWSLPPAAFTCRESWTAITGLSGPSATIASNNTGAGSSIGRDILTPCDITGPCVRKSGIGYDEKGHWPTERLWIANTGRDIFLLCWAGVHEARHSMNKATGWDFLCKRREMAVGYGDFVAFGAVKRMYRCLIYAERLKTLVCIVATPEIYIVTNLVERGGTEKGEETQWWDRKREPLRVAEKFIFYEDREELERVDALWRGVGPESRWVWRSAQNLFRVDAAMYARPMVARCVQCELEKWDEAYLPRVRSMWLRLMCAEEPEIRKDPDIFPDGFEANEEHPWVRQALARMPTVKPAVLLTFIDKHPASDMDPSFWDEARSAYLYRGDRPRGMWDTW